MTFLPYCSKRADEDSIFVGFYEHIHLVFLSRFPYIPLFHIEKEANMFKNYTLNRLLVLVAAVSFAFLLADTIIEHRDILSKELLAYIPVVFSLIGMLVGIGAVTQWNARWIRWFQIFLFASFIVAAAGVYLHIGDDDDREKQTTQVTAQQEKEKDKPLLAPLAFGGIAVVGLLGTSRKWHAEVL